MKETAAQGIFHKAIKVIAIGGGGGNALNHIISHGLKDGDTDGFVNLPLGIGKVRMSIFLREDAGFFRVSVRSKKGCSSNALARAHFHGGGHECAAGGRIFFPGDIASREDAAQYIENVTARFLQSESPSE